METRNKIAIAISQNQWITKYKAEKDAQMTAEQPENLPKCGSQNGKAKSRTNLIRQVVRLIRRSGPLGETLADQAVGVFVRAALPGTVGIGEVGLQRGFPLQLQMLRELLAVVQR